MSFLMPTPKKPPPPPSTPTRADASVVAAGDRSYKPLPSMVSTGNALGVRKAAPGAKSTLIGGAR